MPTATATTAPTLKRFLVNVPAAYWDRDRGLAEGYGFSQECRAFSAREAVEQVQTELAARLCYAGDHFVSFEVGVARISRNPARRTVTHFKVTRSGRVVNRVLRPWFD